MRRLKHVKLFEDYVINESKWNEDIISTSITGSGGIEAKVDDLIKFLKENDYPLKDFNVKKLYDDGHGKHIEDDEYWKTVQVYIKKQEEWVKFIEMDEKDKNKHKEDLRKRIMKSNLDYPIIVGIHGKNTALVDGNHRLEKAYLLKQKIIKGYEVPWKDLLKKFSLKKNRK